MMLEDSRISEPGTVLDPAPKPKRRTYTAEYRARILAEYEAAPYGEKSAVLRREGLYQTLVTEDLQKTHREATRRGPGKQVRITRISSGSWNCSPRAAP